MSRSRLLQPLPWYQWNPGQWQGSRKVQRMTWGARGLYRELMDECWIKGSVPSTVNGVAEMFGVDEPEIAELLPQVIRCFDLQEDQTMTSPFIEELRTEADARRIVQANRRLGKTKNGEPRLTVDNQEEPQTTEPNQSEVEEKRREEKRSTPTPTGQEDQGEPRLTTVSNRATRKPKRLPWKERHDPEVVEATQEIMAIWPDSSKSQPKKGESVPASKGPEVATRLSEIKAQGGDLTICVAIAQRFVDSFNRGGMWAKAAENFFGRSDAAPWHSYYQAHVTNQEMPDAS